MSEEKVGEGEGKNVADAIELSSSVVFTRFELTRYEGRSCPGHVQQNGSKKCRQKGVEPCT